MQIDWQRHYYIANNLWVNINLLGIVPFLVACLNRLRHPSTKVHLFTDHLSRLFLAITCLFYVYDVTVKYMVDGVETVCQKALLIHHVASEFIIIPLVVNRYIPWWANPVAFLHGFLIYFPEAEFLNYLYAVVIGYFQYSLYRQPFTGFPYYRFTLYAINGIWVFALMVLIGDCSNFLPLSPD